ncbi:MAG: tetratricopeptide repeat protein [Candidatus Omnitrophica bacterium]|nr:tetratricopeptide repeat protein [Candidatus Omnitrophota bacterium]
MKKVFLIIIIFGLLFCVSILVQARKHKSDSISSGNFSMPSKESETHQLQPAKGVLEGVLLQTKTAKELSSAQETGDVGNEWGQGKINNKELKEAGLTPGQFSLPQLDKKIKNITAGYDMPDKTFAEALENCATYKDIDEQTKVINSEALSAMGFFALMRKDYGRTEKAFTILIRDYAGSQAASIAQLELARLLFQQGRFTEAERLISNAKAIYGQDEDYLAMVQGMYDEMELNE